MNRIFPRPGRPKEQLPVFKHQPIDSTEIRLLRLQLSSDRASSRKLSGSLETVHLESLDGSVSIEYEALSYFWGSEEADRTILLDNAPFPIKPNLEAALKELSKGNTERMLWIDAICINQSDIKETNEQVRKMSLIYSQAALVIIWIGPRIMGWKNEAPDAIKEFARRQRAGGRGIDSQQLLKWMDNPRDRVETERVSPFNNASIVKQVDIYGGYWPALLDFFGRPWWNRAWVRQELAMSQKAIVQCGEEIVEWRDVAAISHWLKIHNQDIDENFKAWLRNAGDMAHNWKGGKPVNPNNVSGIQYGEDLEYFREMMRSRGEIGFEKMLLHARNCESTDPRDKVYSILGLSGAIANDIVVDYSREVHEVASEAFRKQAALSNSLEALVWSQNPNRVKSIPSWAPNICSPFRTKPSRMKGKSESLYAASGSVRRKEQYAFLDDGFTLKIQGAIIFDVIEKISKSRTGHTTEAQLDHLICAWRPLVFDWLGKMDTAEKYERFMSVIMFGTDIRGQRLPKGPNGLDWGTFFRVTHHSVTARTEFEYLALALRRSTFEGAATSQAELQAWVNLCAAIVGGRQIILTSKGRLGLVPAETQPWDVICLLGLDVPFVLRKIDADTYIVIGEAYIHGAMDGETLSLQSTSDALQVQEILLQ